MRLGRPARPAQRFRRVREAAPPSTGRDVRPAYAKVSISHLWQAFHTKAGELTAVQDVTVDIRQGEFVVVVGPSGCGKTTLLRVLAGLEEATWGEIVVRGGDGNQAENALVFQEQSIFPWMTVEANVAYGLRMRKARRELVRARTLEYIEKTGLTAFRRAYPHELSGGMKQRVAIARAFAVDSDILLMDEPFAALDEQNKTLLQQELLRVWEETQKTVVYVTHGIDEALLLADRIVVMTARPGRIKVEIAVPFPRPRRIVELRNNPQYGRLYEQIWSALKDEVMQARAQESA